jgi:hypothetical protein
LNFASKLEIKHGKLLFAEQVLKLILLLVVLTVGIFFGAGNNMQCFSYLHDWTIGV